MIEQVLYHLHVAPCDGRMQRSAKIQAGRVYRDSVFDELDDGLQVSVLSCVYEVEAEVRAHAVLGATLDEESCYLLVAVVDGICSEVNVLNGSECLENSRFQVL